VQKGMAFGGGISIGYGRYTHAGRLDGKITSAKYILHDRYALPGYSAHANLIHAILMGHILGLDPIEDVLLAIRDQGMTDATHDR
jgi:hypothetical protein